VRKNLCARTGKVGYCARVHRIERVFPASYRRDDIVLEVLRQIGPLTPFTNGRTRDVT
jgi:hypothetical protein